MKKSIHNELVLTSCQANCGKSIEHFLKLFDSSKKYTINKKIACITDLDPVRKLKESSDSNFEKCYPYELDLEVDKYIYKSCSNELVDKQFAENIQCFAENKGKGKTFEYALAYTNPHCKLILTESMLNLKELNKLFEYYQQGKTVDEMIAVLKSKSAENSRIAASIKRYKGSDAREHLIASRYLNSVSKGENAYDLSKALEENLNNEHDCTYFKVPQYIKDAITWICN